MKKLIALLLAMVLCFAMFAGCGTSEAAADAASASAPAASAAEEAPAEAPEAAAAEFTTVTEGVLTMGTNAAFPPYEFYDGDKVVGIDAEIGEAIAQKLGLTLEIVDMDFSSLISAVQSGKIDVSMAGMTVTEERLQNVNFSETYSTGVQVIIVPEGSEIATADDLAGHLIGVQESTTGHIYCSDDFGEDSVIAYTNGATAVQALTDGKVDCVVIDEQPALNFVAANEGLVILETEYVVEDYAAAISKDNDALLTAFNAALAELTADGTVQSILDKYIQ